MQKKIVLGDTSARIDWGYAKDYMDAAWSMLQQKDADDYVIGSGIAYSVRDFVNIVAQELEINIQWKGRGIDEIGIDASTGNTIVSVDARYFRPTEVETLLGDTTKAKEKLGWEPKISFEKLVATMVEADISGLGPQ